MKNSIKVLLIALATFSLTTCKKENLLVTYPESYPKIDQAHVVESTITYGDSITLNVSVSDKVAPLSTLEIQVVVNNEVIKTESARTKGNSASIVKKYHVPFVANRPDNAEVKIYLSSINVEGYQSDTILNTTKAKRPEIKELWVVPIKGTSYKLELTDSVNLIYHSSGMDYGTTVSYFLATKINKFKKVDWSGLVFGKVGEGIGLVSQIADSLTTVDGTLTGISEMTFDALKFEVRVSGKLLEPITTLDINTDLKPVVMDGKNFLASNVYLGKDVEVTFTGLTDMPNSIAPDFFEVTGTNKAKFLGNTGLYKAYYYSDANYLYIDPQPTAHYPDVMWMDGTGFGRPSSPYVTTASWNWNSPFDYAPCNQIAPGIYQVTVYGKNTDNGSGWGTFDFKFFHQRGWFNSEGKNEEIDASKCTIISSSPFVARASDGNVNGTTTAFEGVFRITVDVNEDPITITLEKIN